jgi:hypothetical protein
MRIPTDITDLGTQAGVTFVILKAANVTRLCAHSGDPTKFTSIVRISSTNDIVLAAKAFLMGVRHHDNQSKS